ncbi:hypothetical protein QJS10_CPB18g00536 [Acorus calamus]|uniref:Sieve element occlusion C-terminal domain-containing protein n=1 Tax=Acorus calamus TaxID=4465 RepID=A0AAV9CL29_ACOCL|nr:hypothetical protein QJS10_CPB18g00536 [Acorus calamus]
MQEVMQMMSFDGSEEGWAVVSRGSAEIVKTNGRKIVDCLGKFEEWKEGVEKDGFVSALTAALVPYETHEHCTRLILPGDTADTPCILPNHHSSSYNDLQRITEVGGENVIEREPHGGCRGRQGERMSQGSQGRE